MNKELIERLALEVKQTHGCLLKTDYLVSILSDFLSAVDAERGGEAAMVFVKHANGDEVTVDLKMPHDLPVGEYPLFLAPQIPEGMAMDALSMVIAGALFDFTGYLTTRDADIEVGAHNVAGPIMELLKEFAAMRNLPLDDAAVLSWQETLIAAAGASMSQGKPSDLTEYAYVMLDPHTEQADFIKTLADTCSKAERIAIERAAEITGLRDAMRETEAFCKRKDITIRTQAERIKELEEEDTEIHRLKDATINAQSDKLAKADAVIEAAGIALQEVQDLIHESRGIYGMHMNDDESPWIEIEQGGRFERLCTLPDALSDIEQYQKREEA